MLTAAHLFICTNIRTYYYGKIWSLSRYHNINKIFYIPFVSKHWVSTFWFKLAPPLGLTSYVAFTPLSTVPENQPAHVNEQM